MAMTASTAGRSSSWGKGCARKLIYGAIRNARKMVLRPRYLRCWTLYLRIFSISLAVSFGAINGSRAKKNNPKGPNWNIVDSAHR